MGALAIAYIRLLVLAPSSDRKARSLAPIFTVLSLSTSVLFFGYEISQASQIASLWEQRAVVEMRLARERCRVRRMQERLLRDRFHRWREFVQCNTQRGVVACSDLEFSAAISKLTTNEQLMDASVAERLQPSLPGAENFRQHAIRKDILDDTTVALSVEKWRSQLAELRASQDPLYISEFPSPPASLAPAHAQLAASIRRTSSMANLRRKASSRLLKSDSFGKTSEARLAMRVGQYLAGSKADENTNALAPDTPQTEDTRLASSIRRRASDSGLVDDDRLAAAIAQWRSRNAMPMPGDSFAGSEHRAPFEAVGAAPVCATVTSDVSIDIDGPTSPAALQLKKSATGGRRFSLKFDVGAFMAVTNEASLPVSKTVGSDEDAEGGTDRSPSPVLSRVKSIRNLRSGPAKLLRGSSRRAQFETVAHAPRSETAIASEVSIDMGGATSPTSPSALQLKKSASGDRRFSLKFDTSAFMDAFRGGTPSSDDGGSESETSKPGVSSFIAQRLPRGLSRRAQFETVTDLGSLQTAPTSLGEPDLVSTRIMWDGASCQLKVSHSASSLVELAPSSSDSPSDSPTELNKAAAFDVEASSEPSCEQFKIAEASARSMAWI